MLGIYFPAVAQGGHGIHFTERRQIIAVISRTVIQPGHQLAGQQQLQRGAVKVAVQHFLLGQLIAGGQAQEQIIGRIGLRAERRQKHISAGISVIIRHFINAKFHVGSRQGVVLGEKFGQAGRFAFQSRRKVLLIHIFSQTGRKSIKVRGQHQGSVFVFLFVFRLLRRGSGLCRFLSRGHFFRFQLADGYPFLRFFSGHLHLLHHGFGFLHGYGQGKHFQRLGQVFLRRTEILDQVFFQFAGFLINKVIIFQQKRKIFLSQAELLVFGILGQLFKQFKHTAHRFFGRFGFRPQLGAADIVLRAGI